MDELKELSNDIREFLVDNISKTGGHLASNLGIVELLLRCITCSIRLQINLYGMLDISLMCIKY